MTDQDKMLHEVEEAIRPSIPSTYQDAVDDLAKTVIDAKNNGISEDELINRLEILLSAMVAQKRQTTLSLGAKAQLGDVNIRDVATQIVNNIYNNNIFTGKPEVAVNADRAFFRIVKDIRVQAVFIVIVVATLASWIVASMTSEQQIRNSALSDSLKETQFAVIRTQASISQTQLSIEVTSTAYAQLVVPTTPPVVRDGVTLERVKANGLACGINGVLTGFSEGIGAAAKGFDVAYCYALGAALGISPDRVRLEPLNINNRFSAVQIGADEKPLVDVVFRNTSRTGIRDLALGIDFGPTIYYDSQRILAHESFGITNTTDLSELSEIRICVMPKTTTLDNLRVRFGDRLVPIFKKRSTDALEFPNSEAMFDAFFEQYENGSSERFCDAISSDESQIIANLFKRESRSSGTIKKFLFLEEYGRALGTEFLSPYIAEGDKNWFEIVTWATYVPMQAAELEITQQEVKERVYEGRTDVRGKFLYDNPIAKDLGLQPNFAALMIASQGNYEEMFYSNLYDMLKMVRIRIISNTPFDLEVQKALAISNPTEREQRLRDLLIGPNKLALKGGGLVAPPPLGVP